MRDMFIQVVSLSVGPKSERRAETSNSRRRRARHGLVLLGFVSMLLAVPACGQESQEADDSPSLLDQRNEKLVNDLCQELRDRGEPSLPDDC